MLEQSDSRPECDDLAGCHLLASSRYQEGFVPFLSERRNWERMK